MKKNYSTNLDTGTFVKKAPISKSSVEILMSRAAYEFSGSEAGFYCPKLHSFDKESGEMTFELLVNCKNLRAVFIEKAGFFSSKKDRDKLQEIFKRVGKSLYYIHSKLFQQKDLEKHSLPFQYVENQEINDLVFIHGDFTLNNVMYDESLDKIYFIDWSSSPFFEQPANFGSRFWDLSFFISSTFYFSFSTLSKIVFRKKLIDNFLSGYLENYQESSFSLKRKMFIYLSENNYFNLYRSFWREKNLSIKIRFLQYISKNSLNRYIRNNKGS